MPHFRRPSVLCNALLACALCATASPQSRTQPSIEFTTIPPSGNGNAVRVDIIEGRVTGALSGQRIVLYAQSVGSWWVQPAVSQPFTDILPGSRWKGITHPGTSYAALLVDSRYVPAPKISQLPEKGGSILAVAVTTPAPGPTREDKQIQFSGYPWRVREAGRQQSGQVNFYDPANAWTDQNGFLHLRLTKRGDTWMCAEVALSRSLGYGSYRFVVRDISRLEPSAVFIVGPSAKMAIELSRWGRPEDKNAQYVITPYSVPANTVRFTAPSGTLTHWMLWEPARVVFRSVRGSPSKPGRDAVAEHTFTSGVQAPGNERISLNLYALVNSHNPLQHPLEVIVERFEFLP